MDVDVDKLLVVVMGQSAAESQLANSLVVSMFVKNLLRIALLCSVCGQMLVATQLNEDAPSTALPRVQQQQQQATELHTRVLDMNITAYVSAALLLLMFLNLGTVLDLQRLRQILCRPVGPLLGFCSRYLLMPLLAITLGYALWPRQSLLQLALCYTALAPSGGLANVCTIFLKGNINLSLANTTLNSLLALGMLPLWTMLLGCYVYPDNQLHMPYAQLGIFTAVLLICLATGLMLRMCVPKTTRFIFRFLKPLSVLLSLCLIGLTVGLNASVFKQLTWRVALASVCLPLAGFLLVYFLSKLVCRSNTDALTLATETSVLNMTLPIVLLQANQLEQQAIDLVLIVPIMSALVSLLLIVMLYVVRRLCGWNVRENLDAFDEKQFLVENNDGL